MDRKEAEKLKAERARRRRRKNIRGYTLMALCALALVAAIFFGVKAALNTFGDKDVPENPIGGTEIAENTQSGETTEENKAEEKGDETVAEENSDEEVADENTEKEPENTETSAPPSEKPDQSWSTMLVNQWSYMPEGYVPEVRAIVYEGVSPANNKFDVRAAEELEQMLADARSAGYNM